jgi:hypothetical protein
MATDDQEHPEEISIDGRRWLDEHNNPENWIEEEFEAQPQCSMREIVEKTRQVFGVDISTVCHGPLVDSLLHISERIKGQPVHEGSSKSRTAETKGAPVHRAS